MQPYPPLGPLYAAAVLREHGLSVAVFDAMLQEPSAGFRKALRVHRPEMLAIYEDDFNFLTKMCLTRMRELAFEMMEEARRFGARVLVHGSDATDHSVEYLRRGCDYILVGEAEHTLLDLIQALRGGRDASEVSGVTWLRHAGSEEIVQTDPKRMMHRPTAFPLPARDLIDVGKYRAAWR